MVHSCWSMKGDMKMMHGTYDANIAGQSRMYMYVTWKKLNTYG